MNGGAGDDTLVGGVGADTLIGGAGADIFLFDVLETTANRDALADFVHLTDHLAFSRTAFSAFAALPVGALDPAQLVLGSVAATAQHHLVYAQATGSLCYDPDGAGGAAQVLVAVLTTKPALTAADFLLV